MYGCGYTVDIDIDMIELMLKEPEHHILMN